MLLRPVRGYALELIQRMILSAAILKNFISLPDIVMVLKV